MGKSVIADQEILDEFAFETLCPSLKICFGDIADVGVAAATAAEKYDSDNPFPSASLEILNSFRKVKPRSTCSPASILPGELFDCLEACMDKETRTSIESMFFVPAIKDPVETYGEERKNRNVTVDIWKAYFSWFRMGEVDLSKAALYQARLVTEQFSYGEFCTLNSKRKSLIVGRKGTPFQSISVFGCT